MLDNELLVVIFIALIVGLLTIIIPLRPKSPPKPQDVHTKDYSYQFTIEWGFIDAVILLVGLMIVIINALIDSKVLFWLAWVIFICGLSIFGFLVCQLFLSMIRLLEKE